MVAPALGSRVEAGKKMLINILSLVEFYQQLPSNHDFVILSSPCLSHDIKGEA